MDFPRGRSIYYLPDGESIKLPLHEIGVVVSAAFDASAVQAAIREAQMKAPGYSYAGFCRKVMGAGCAG